MIPKRKAAPAALPVSTAEIRAQVRNQGFTDDDAVLEGFIRAATRRLDGYDGILGRCLMTQTWESRFCDWDTVLRLPFPDVTRVVVTYLDAQGAEQTVDAGDYELVEMSMGVSVIFKDRFSAPAVSDDTRYPIALTYDAGYGNAGDVPDPIKIAIMMLAAHFYEHRAAVGDGSLSEVPMGVSMLVAPYRRIGL